MTSTDTRTLEERCVHIFKDMLDLRFDPEKRSWSDERLANEPLDSFELDSLSALEFVMHIEDEFDVTLNEKRVNACQTIADLAKLVAEARQ